jgi:hypothetical protein
VRPNYKALEEARQKLVAEGLFRDKRKAKAKGGKSTPKQGSKSSSTTATASGLGVEKGGVAKKAGAWAAANAAGGAKGKSVSTGGTVKTERKDGKRKHVPGKESSRTEGEAAAKAGKKKRPGPALRRAMKQEAAKEGGVAVGAPAAAAGSPDEPTQRASNEDASRQQQKAGDGKVARGMKHGKKTLHLMTDDEKAKARAASYAGVDHCSLYGTRCQCECGHHACYPHTLCMRSM